MKRRWAFFLSLGLSAFALCLEFCAGGESIDAKKQLTEFAIRNTDPATGRVKASQEADTASARALLHQSEILSWFTVPPAAASGLFLFLSHRRKEPTAWRGVVVAVLVLYLYFLGGPL